MEAKLIKLEQGYILVSLKEITLSDTLIPCYYFFNNEIIKREYSHHKDGKKIIASDFIPELPRIDFNGLEEEFGIVSYHKLYNEDIKKYNISYSSNNSDTYLGFNLGFNKCLELNKDKLYTLEDLKDAFNAGNAGSGGFMKNRVRKYNGVDEYLQTFLTWHNETGYIQKTEWDVEVEMTNWFENDYTIIMKLK